MCRAAEKVGRVYEELNAATEKVEMEQTKQVPERLEQSISGQSGTLARTTERIAHQTYDRNFKAIGALQQPFLISSILRVSWVTSKRTTFVFFAVLGRKP